MIAASIESLSVAFGSDPVFEALSWEIHDDRITGLIGPNGCGKSTLLRLIAGELSPNSGNLSRRQGLRVGYLPQDPVFQTRGSLLDEVASANTSLAEVESHLRQVESGLANPDVYNDPVELARILARQERLLDKYARLGGPSYNGRVISTLRRLGFHDEEFDLPQDALSGGQKKLVGLARLIVNEPDLLLLDEPDNHLDFKGKSFLVRFVREFKGGVIIVSHDRFMLDLVADEIVELFGQLLGVCVRQAAQAVEAAAALSGAAKRDHPAGTVGQTANDVGQSLR
jgi:ATP-binding cassette, subfamily F, member 3